MSAEAERLRQVLRAIADDLEEIADEELIVVDRALARIRNNLGETSRERSYTVTIREDARHREVEARNRAGVAFAGHGDSTRTIPLGNLLAAIARDLHRDWIAHRPPR